MRVHYLLVKMFDHYRYLASVINQEDYLSYFYFFQYDEKHVPLPVYF